MTTATLPALARNKDFTANLDTFTKSSVGVREQPLGSNWGPEVSKYLASVAINFPASWCAGYVNYQIKNAATHAGVISHWLPSASCSALYGWAKHNGLLLPAPTPFCVFLKQSSHDESVCVHTGIVIAVEGGRVRTREGNSNNDGSSNGIGVFEETRSLSGLVFVQIV